MHLSEIQAYAAAQIAANPTLSPLGAAIVFSLFTEDETARTQIETAIRATGVCIEIGSVEATGAGDKPQNRYTLVDAKFEVFIAESPTVAHTPQEMPLVASVATAVQARTGPTAPAIRCTGYSAAKSENGYILHVLSFTSPVLL